MAMIIARMIETIIRAMIIMEDPYEDGFASGIPGGCSRHTSLAALPKKHIFRYSIQMHEQFAAVSDIMQV